MNTLYNLEVVMSYAIYARYVIYKTRGIMLYAVSSSIISLDKSVQSVNYPNDECQPS